MKIKIFLLALVFPILVRAELQCPPNSSPGYLGESCYCNTGFQVKNNRCSKIELPENAKLIYGGSWACNLGYRKVGNRCDEVHLPKNARFTYGGNWSCNIGYIENNDQCDKVTLPKNAHFIFGSTWKCDSGFKKNVNTCVPMTNNELIQQVNLLNKMLLIEMAKSENGNCSTVFRACKDECDDQFSSYSDQNMCVKACKIGMSACK